jgi:hypothetical protein
MLNKKRVDDEHHCQNCGQNGAYDDPGHPGHAHFVIKIAYQDAEGQEIKGENQEHYQLHFFKHERTSRGKFSLLYN